MSFRVSRKFKEFVRTTRDRLKESLRSALGREVKVVITGSFRRHTRYVGDVDLECFLGASGALDLKEVVGAFDVGRVRYVLFHEINAWRLREPLCRFLRLDPSSTTMIDLWTRTDPGLFLSHDDVVESRDLVRGLSEETDVFALLMEVDFDGGWVVNFDVTVRAGRPSPTKSPKKSPKTTRSLVLGELRDQNLYWAVYAFAGRARGNPRLWRSWKTFEKRWGKLAQLKSYLSFARRSLPGPSDEAVGTLQKLCRSAGIAFREDLEALEETVESTEFHGILDDPFFRETLAKNMFTPPGSSRRPPPSPSGAPV